MTKKRGRVYLVGDFGESEPTDSFRRGLPLCPFHYSWEEVEELELNNGLSVYILVNSGLDEVEHDRQAGFITQLRELGYDVRDDVPLS